MLPIGVILHPTDFSESSACAFDLACALARDYKAKLCVAHVKQSVVALDQMGVVAVPEPPDAWARLEEQLRLVKPLDPKILVEYFLREGDPVFELLDVAAIVRCDLIVMGTHGRTGFGRLLMGSIAEQIVRKAPCPVLTLKAPAAGADREAKPEKAKSTSDRP